jgi:hypothetical protein
LAECDLELEDSVSHCFVLDRVDWDHLGLLRDERWRWHELIGWNSLLVNEAEILGVLSEQLEVEHLVVFDGSVNHSVTLWVTCEDFCAEIEECLECRDICDQQGRV